MGENNEKGVIKISSDCGWLKTSGLIIKPHYVLTDFFPLSYLYSEKDQKIYTGSYNNKIFISGQQLTNEIEIENNFLLYDSSINLALLCMKPITPKLPFMNYKKSNKTYNIGEELELIVRKGDFFDSTKTKICRNNPLYYDTSINRYNLDTNSGIYTKNNELVGFRVFSPTREGYNVCIKNIAIKNFLYRASDIILSEIKKNTFAPSF
jgi:hypothetical protein